MRIPPSSILWLATALSAGLASGDEVYFLQDAFTIGAEQEPVFPVTAVSDATALTKITKTFDWYVNQTVDAAVSQRTIAVTQVNLYVSATATPVASASNNAGSGSIPATATATSASGMGIMGGSTTTMAPDVPAPQEPTPETTSIHSSSPAVQVPPAAAVRRGDDSGPIQVVGQSDDSSSLNGDLLSISNDSLTTGKVTINDMAQLLGDYPTELLYFELLWVDAISGDGRSYSRYFALVANADSAAQIASEPQITSTAPAIPEQTGLGFGAGSTASVVTATSTAVSGAASTTAVEPNVGGGSTPTPQAAGHPSHGLSTGAIAGIAVAAALVGLALLAAVLFCLRRLRRRRDRRIADSPGGYGSRATPELIAQKEAGAGVGVEVSPHSPYADDGGVGAPLGGVPRGAVGQEEVPLAGYGLAERAVSHGSVVEEGTSFGGSQVGRDTPTAVRHLVEEGMTEEEIRRLEEEERELDQAIEQAGGTR